MTPCGLVEICQGVGGTYCLHFPSFSWVVLAPNDMLAVLCPLLVTLYSPIGVQPSLSTCVSWHTSWVPFLSHHFPLSSMQNCVLFCCPCTVSCLFQCSLLFTYTSPNPSLGCIGCSSGLITYKWVPQGAVSLFLSLYLFLSFSSAAYLSTLNTKATSNTSV